MQDKQNRMLDQLQATTRHAPGGKNVGTIGHVDPKRVLVIGAGPSRITGAIVAALAREVNNVIVVKI